MFKTRVQFAWFPKNGRNPPELRSHDRRHSDRNPAGRNLFTLKRPNRRLRKAWYLSQAFLALGGLVPLLSLLSGLASLPCRARAFLPLSRTGVPPSFRPIPALWEAAEKHRRASE